MPLYNIKKIISKKPYFGFLLPRFKIKLPNPLFLLVYITLDCNRNCNWCYQKKDAFYNLHSGNMPIDAFENILRSFNGIFFKPHIHLFGGEPLVYPFFSEFLKVCKKYQYFTSITTNADYLYKYIEIIKDGPVKQLNISINESPNLLLNPNYHNLLLSKFMRIKEIKKKIINLNYTITAHNYQFLENIVLFLNKNFRKNEIAFFVLQHFMFGDGRLNSGDKQLDIDILSIQIKKIKKLKLNFRLLFLPDIKINDLGRYYCSNDIFKNKCYVPWLGLSIFPDLTVVPGNGALFCNKKVGDLHIETIHKIWHGQKLAEFRDKLLSGGLDSNCNRCCQKFYY